MKFEKVRPGEYKAQLRGAEYVWVLREGRKWFWVLGGYAQYPEVWDFGNAPFASRKEAIRDVIATYS